MNGTDACRQTHPQPLIAPFVALGSTTLKSDKSLRRMLIPLAPADQHLVGGGFEGEAEAEETVEGGVRGAAAVEAEDELVEVGLEVRRP
jgi:hypothetical protein